MAQTLRLHQLPPSPNNIKVRIALGYKGLAYESAEVKIKGFPPSAEERAELVRISGQPLTPVLVHGDRVVYDSAAILRYLDVSFPDTPRLFSTDYAEMKEIETWEIFGRTELAKPLSAAFAMATSGRRDGMALEEARSLLHELTGRLEDRLANTGWLVGDRMTAADVTAVPTLHYSTLPEGVAASGPITSFLDANLKLGSGRDRVRAWVDRVRAFDPSTP